MSKETKSVKAIASGTTTTWANPGGDVSLCSVIVESTGGAVNATITIELNDGTNDFLLNSATDAALTSVGFYPDAPAVVSKGESLVITSTVSGNYQVRITTAPVEG